MIKGAAAKCRDSTMQGNNAKSICTMYFVEIAGFAAASFVL